MNHTTFVYKANPGNATQNYRITRAGRDWSSSSLTLLAQRAVNWNRSLRTLSALVLNTPKDKDFKSFNYQLQFGSNVLEFKAVLPSHKLRDEEHTKSEQRTTVH